MAVEGGCTWMVLDIADADSSSIRDEAVEIAALCREAGVMLTVVDHPELAKEFGFHGVFLSKGKSAVDVRNEFGPEAVIGTVVGSAEAATTLEKADIDYVGLDETVSLADAASIISSARECGAEIPFVALCKASELTPDGMTAILNAGYSGFFAIDGVFDAPDPVEYISRVLAFFN